MTKILKLLRKPNTYLSVLHEAKLSSVCQSTSRAGAEWKANCCLCRPVWESHMMVVLSTPAGQTSFYKISQWTDGWNLSTTRAENVVSTLIPLKGKDWPLMLSQGILQLPAGWPNSGIAVVRSGREKGAAAVPVQWGDILITGVLKWKEDM